MSEETQELTARIEARAKWLHDAFEKEMAIRDPDWDAPGVWEEANQIVRNAWTAVAARDLLERDPSVAPAPLPEGAIICPHCGKVLEIDSKAFANKTLVPPAEFAVQITCCRRCRCALTVLVQPMG